jgi:polysaccharide biosynthesis transport protein
MELEQYITLLKKWAWLLIFGLVLGALASYLFSLTQPVIYETSTRVFISRASDQANPYEYTSNELRLVSTYAQLINTEPVLTKLFDRLGYQIERKQISVRQISDSILIEITVNDQDPNKASLIANTLVEVFIQHNQELQSEQYQASEESLAAQIAQIEAQIATLEEQMLKTSEITEQTQQAEIEQRLSELNEQLQLTETDIIQVEEQLAAFFPIPEPTSTPFNPWSATATPVPTPTLSPIEMVDYKETQNELEKLNSLRNLYTDTYAQMLVLGDNSQNPSSVEDNYNQIQSTLMLYQQMYANLINNYESVRLARLRSSINVIQVEPAPVPLKPIQPQPLRSAALGAVTGLMIMGGLAFLIEYLDDTLKTPDDIERYLNLRVLASVGEMKYPKGVSKSENGVYTREFPLSPISEAFYTMRTNLRYMNVDKPLRSILITSIGPGEGKTTTAVNLAAVIAQGEQSVILVDADFRKPKVNEMLKIANLEGLSDLFLDIERIPDVIKSWGDPALNVITSGKFPPNPNELLGSTVMKKIIARLQKQADLIILDSPPSIVADALVLSQAVDGVILVVEPGKTKIGMTQSLVAQYNQIGAKIIGVVLNPISRRHARYYGKYYYNYSPYSYNGNHYHSYYTDNSNSRGKKSTKSKSSDTDNVIVSDHRPSADQ